MTDPADLDVLPTRELHDRAIAQAKERRDVGFLWRLVKALPAAEEVAGDEDRAKADIAHPLALINAALYDSDSGALGEALRPLYVEYLAGDGDDAGA